MSLTQALNTAMAGLRATQTGLALISSNVSNADTPGYVRKSLSLVSQSASGAGVSVKVSAVTRELDKYLQRQLRTETSGGTYSGLRAQFYERIQQIYGEPGSDSALESVFNDFTASLQALSTSPESYAARNNALSAAKSLVQQLNSMTTDLQALRLDAEQGLASAVLSANNAMSQIASINGKLATSTTDDSTKAVLLDQRDQYLDQLSQLMDIRVIEGDRGQITVFTTSGIQLVGSQASQFAFDAQGMMTATTEWSADPAERTVGTVMLVTPTGSMVDLIANKAIRSGKIAAYVEMRDQVLPQAQAQLDELAAAMASALSDKTVAGTPVTSGAQAGFDVDVGGLLPGNTLKLTYTDTATNTARTVTLKMVDDPTALPLSNNVTADPNDRVIGINMSGGIAGMIAEINTALGSSGLTFSNPAGTTLRVLDDGAANTVTLNKLSATSTATSLTGGSAEFPFFVDANMPYTGEITGQGSQSIGLAGRIAVNEQLLADPTRLVVYQGSPQTAAGDATRPNFILDRLTNAALEYSPSAGIGTVVSPYTGTLGDYMRQAISQQGEAADAAAKLNEGQSLVVSALQQRVNDDSGVNVDQEMANLLALQTAYGANARLMSVVKELYDVLMRM